MRHSISSYVDALPWADVRDADGRDGLALHPLARAYAERDPSLVGEEWFAKVQLTPDTSHGSIFPPCQEGCRIPATRRSHSKTAPRSHGGVSWAQSLNTARTARKLLEDVYAEDEEGDDDDLEWCSEERLFRAVVLVASRAFDLSAAWVAAHRARGGGADAAANVADDVATTSAEALAERRNYVSAAPRRSSTWNMRRFRRLRAVGCGASWS